MKGYRIRLDSEGVTYLDVPEAKYWYVESNDLLVFTKAEDSAECLVIPLRHIHHFRPVTDILI